MKQKDTKIAIIGAGPSGLVSALELKKRGYTNVTVYEASDKVGGKVNTINIEGKPYEQGAIVVSSYFKEVRKLAKEYNCLLSKFEDLGVLNEHGKSHVVLKDFVQKEYSKKAIVKNLLFVLFQGIKNRTLRAPSMHGKFSSDLYHVMDDYINENPSVSPIANGTKSAYVGMGYGYFEEVPALYFMKFYWRQCNQKWKEMGRIIKKGDAHEHYYFPDGYQALFEKIALDLKINFNHSVTSVKRVDDRSNKKIQVEANNQVVDFDHVIIASPPSTVRKFLVMNECEKHLFTKAKHYRYFSFIFEAKNLPFQGKSGFFGKRTAHSTRGHIMGLTNYQNTSIWIGYLQAEANSDDDQIRETILKDLREEGGELVRMHTLKEWEYFPYLDGPALKEDLFHKLWNQQAEERIYFTGSFFNLETVEHSIRHAKKMVKTFFK